MTKRQRHIILGDTIAERRRRKPRKDAISALSEVTSSVNAMYTISRSYGGLLEPRGSNLTPLKSTFNAEHFVGRLSWSIFNGFGAIHA